MTGFSSDGKHTRFFLERGETYRVRSIAYGELGTFALAPVIAMVAGLLSLLCFLNARTQPAPAELSAAFVICGMLLLVMATLGAIRAGSLVPWKEWVLFFVTGGALETSGLTGFSSLWWRWETVAGIAAALFVLGWYVSYGVARAIWEPLIAALAFLGYALMLAAWPHLSLSVASAGAFLLMVVGFLGWMNLSFDHYQYERGRDRLPYD